MRVGVPTEVKNNEFRVAIAPAGVAELTRRGHDVLIQAGAGEGSSISDADFKAAGAQLITTAERVWADADLVLKVKEPVPAEFSHLHRGQTLFTFLHLAAARSVTGTAGYNAARVANGMGAHVTVFDVNATRLRELDAEFGGRIDTRCSSVYDIEDAVKRADLVIGSVLVPGGRAPHVVPNSLVAHMKRGAVLVDIAIDQGGCFEGSRPTTHDRPTFAVHDTLFYCVTNMPAAVPRTSTFALTNASMPYLLTLADQGWQAACRSDPALAKGLSTHDGALVSEQVATDLGLAFTDPADVLC